MILQFDLAPDVIRYQWYNTNQSSIVDDWFFGETQTLSELFFREC